MFRDVDPNFAIVSIQPFKQQIDVNFDEWRLLVRLSGFFGALSLILASLGLYGVTAYNVASRTPEIRACAWRSEPTARGLHSLYFKARWRRLSWDS